MPSRLGRYGTAGMILLCSLLFLFAEGSLAPDSAPRLIQESTRPKDRAACLILARLNSDLEDHPQSREIHLLQRFYLARNGRPAWFNRQGVGLAAHQLLDTLEKSDAEGLPSRRYEPAALHALLALPVVDDLPYFGWPPTQIAEVDYALSRAFFRYAGDNLWGQERSWKSRGDWHRRPRSVDPSQLLELALDLDALPSALRGVVPAAPGYRQLRRALERYRIIASRGGWNRIAEGAALHPGESDPRVSALRKRLASEGDLSDPNAAVDDAELFDPALTQALRHFQTRHGLESDGALGPGTLAALNVPVAERIAQLVRNLERWRWEGDTEAIVRINLADFSLAVNDGETRFEMPVVIGQRQHPTPLFSSQLQALVFSPYWYVPPSLLSRTLPRIVADPSYLKRNHYEVLDSTGNPLRLNRALGRQWQQGELEAALRQQPGPWNPMGNVKFLLPNPWAIYLHDTPEKDLFSRSRRAFSSGCIRLSQPQRLATWLLEREAYSAAQIDAYRSAGTPRLIGLKQPVDLQIGYWTAWVDDREQVHFSADIYGRDSRLARELRQRPAETTLARLDLSTPAQTASIPH